MLRLISPIEVYIKLTLDVSGDGRKQVRCIRQADPFQGLNIQAFRASVYIVEAKLSTDGHPL
jgi:hypothetical protein